MFFSSPKHLYYNWKTITSSHTVSFPPRTTSFTHYSKRLGRQSSPFFTFVTDGEDEQEERNKRFWSHSEPHQSSISAVYLLDYSLFSKVFPNIHDFSTPPSWICQNRASDQWQLMDEFDVTHDRLLNFFVNGLDLLHGSGWIICFR